MRPVPLCTRALTVGDWSRQDCEEFLDDLEKEFTKVNKELDTYPLVDCEPGVKRKSKRTRRMGGGEEGEGRVDKAVVD